ncbi:ImmA/IrrE family metallo-endopeptidase [Prauserella muralis]|uniref:ImmA/IrrE family metallo-endopeptidase n=1 Tax=Prauserella muralis TaxID=588067 RepID=UPI001FE84806|nr:ImmA/IrrE family metallo-endopeptidase [Prauserella muralis]
MLSHRRIVNRARRRARTVLAAVPAPYPWSLDNWVDRLEQHRGRPIDLVEMVYTPGGPVGAWRARPDRDLIIYAVNTSLVHQDFVALHEIAHMLCGHRGRCLISPEQAARHAPDLGEAALEHLFGRATTDEEELEAETMATALLSAATTPPAIDPAATDEAARRARRAMEVFG